MIKNIALIGIVVVAILLFIILPVIERKKRKYMLSNRDSIPIGDIYTIYYQNTKIKKETIIDLWKTISDILHVDPGLLRPDDKTIHLRCMNFSLKNDIDSLEDYIASQLSKADIPKRLDTIDDIIKCLTAKRQ